MSAPRIFYWAYDLQRPTGGEKRSYHHVAILRRHGYDARVLHRSRDFRLGWFGNDVPGVGDADFAGLLRP